MHVGEVLVGEHIHVVCTNMDIDNKDCVIYNYNLL